MFRYFLIFLTFFNLLLINNCFTSVWFIIHEYNLHYKSKNDAVIPDDTENEKNTGNVLKKEYMSLVVIILSALVSIIN